MAEPPSSSLRPHIPRPRPRPRRIVLAAALCAPASAALGGEAGAEPDERLHRLCAEALAAEATTLARDDEEGDAAVLKGVGPGIDGEVQAWRARLRAISHLAALSPLGLQAKARLLLELQPYALDSDPVATVDALIDQGAAEEALLLSLLADILRPRNGVGAA